MGLLNLPKAALAGMAVAVMLALGGCAPPGQPEVGTEPATKVGGASGRVPAERQVLRRGNGAEPETLDPHRATSVTSGNILRDLYEGLVTTDPDGNLVPGTAGSWTISEDGRRYVFRIRPEARWSNGDPLGAADFVYGLRRSVDPRTLSQYSAMLLPIENAAGVIAGELPPDRLGVAALDTHVLEIRLESPTPYFLGLLTHASAYPVHRPSLERLGDRFARPGQLVSNGAFTLGEWVVHSHIRLLRNRRYHADATNRIDEVWLYPIDNAEAELQRYRTGALDITYGVPARHVQWLKRNLPRDLHIAPYFGSYYYGINLDRAPLGTHRDLRQALSLALDREILTEKVAGAGELPAYAFVPPLPGYESPVPDWAAWTQAERDAEAKRLYARAGYGADRPLSIQLLYNTDNNHRRLAVAMAAMWRETLGVRTELLNQEWQVFLQTRREMIDTEVFRAGWIGDYLDPYTFLEILHSGSGLNDTGYAREDYDRTLEEAAREIDPARRFRLLAEAEKLMLEDVPVIPLYFYVSKHLVKPWVGDYRPNLMDHVQSRHLYILEH